MMKSLPVLLLFSLLLTACSPGAPMPALTPEQAAIQAFTRTNRVGVVVDQASIKVLQRVDALGKTFVIITNNHQDQAKIYSCIWLYEAHKAELGSWRLGSGGGGCSEQALARKQPIQIAGGTQGGTNPADPGICYAFGLVNQKDIARVRVTWEDGQVQEVPVMNSSYVSLRAGNISTTRIEGQNQQGKIVFNQASQ